MHNNDLMNFTSILMGMGILYHQEISDKLIEIYWQALQGFEFRDLQRAYRLHVNNPDSGQYFPKPADIVKIIEGSGETKALHAWAKVEKAISQIGSYQSIIFDDGLIHAVIEDLGGWIKLCNTLSTEMSYRAHEFQKRYMVLLLRPPERYPKFCCGILEALNNKNGYPTQARLIVGDLKKAKQVMLSGHNKTLDVHYEDVVHHKD